MPTEIRHILFKPSEVITALLLLQRQRRIELPTGTIEAADADDDANGLPFFTIQLRPDDAARATHGAHIPLRFGSADLQAALLLQCRERNLPLPMKGSKVIQRFGSKLGLVVAIGNADTQDRIVQRISGMN